MEFIIEFYLNLQEMFIFDHFVSFLSELYLIS